MHKLNIIVCWLKTIFYTIFYGNGNIVSGHTYKEIYNNKDIQILKCELCNHISIAFYKVEE